MDTQTTAIAALALLVISCGISAAAGGGARSSWAWGLFGPLGWLIASACGVQARLDDIANRLPPPR